MTDENDEIVRLRNINIAAGMLIIRLKQELDGADQALTEAMNHNDDTCMVVAERDLLEGKYLALMSLVEKFWQQHMRFGVIGMEEVELPCADWCYLCKLEAAEARAEKAEQALATLYETARGNTTSTEPSCDLEVFLDDHRSDVEFMTSFIGTVLLTIVAFRAAQEQEEHESPTTT